jgi:hypothetical protein
LIPSSEVYLVHGKFDPEATIRVFNDAIEQSLTDGFSGFRAAAEISSALDPNGGIDRRSPTRPYCERSLRTAG